MINHGVDVKVTRSRRSVDLSLPLDGLDMFLLSQLDMFTSTAEIAELAPCAPDETLRRFERMAKYGLVEMERPMPRAAMGRMPSVENALPEFEQRVTQRPKAPPVVNRTQMGIGPVELAGRGLAPASRTEASGIHAGRAPQGRGPVVDERQTSRSGGRTRTLASGAGAVAAELVRSIPPVEIEGAERSERASGVVEREAPRPGIALPEAKSSEPGVFSRMTMIDEDVMERARATKA